MHQKNVTESWRQKGAAVTTYPHAQLSEYYGKKLILV
jgi:hypothetical protein